MTDQTLAEQLAGLSDEERAAVEAAAAAKAAESQAAEETDLYDARQDGKLNDPRDLGPVGGSHVEG